MVVDYPVAYVKRPLPTDNQGNLTELDSRRAVEYHAGGDLYVRDRASPSATERNVTGSITGGKGDVKDVSVSYDGNTLLFAVRLPDIDGADPAGQPTWNIWAYDIANRRLSRVIASDITAEEGQDMGPHFLPDGRIVFTSTRQRQSKATLLDEGKPQFAALDEDRREPALNLHVMNADGSDIQQISFNQSHDLDPTVLSDGHIVFTRWDDMGGRNRMSLYTINPDGTHLQLLYGANSHNTGTAGTTIQFLKPRELPDGEILVLQKPFTATGGNLLTVDSSTYVENTQPTAANQGLTGPAQRAATDSDVHTDGTPSPGGLYSAAYPLRDGTDRLLVSWSSCRIMDGGRIVPCASQGSIDPQATQAPPLYGLWVYDRSAGTQLPVVKPQEGIMYTDVVVAKSRSLPSIVSDATLPASLVSEHVGILDIRSVYDVDGSATQNIAALADPAQTTADQRPARFLRIVKAVGIPDRDVRDFSNTAFGRSSQQLMREIIGYTRIEPDGSVKVEVPADVPLAISVVDKDGRRISQRHQNWIQVRAGETVSCVGCHDANSGVSHGRDDAFNSVYSGAATSGQPFPNTVAALWANMGETMAQTRTRISCYTDCAALKPTLDVVFQDDWTDPGVRAPDAAFSYDYSNLSTTAPGTVACETQWDSTCRVVINYPDHIAPLWTLTRQTLDGMGNVLTDHTCVACHSTTDSMNATRVPEGQLDLSATPSSDEPDHLTSYRELLFNDNKQILNGGALEDELVQATDANGNPVFETDSNGNIILDGSGNPIPVMVPINVPPTMSTAGAAASSGFFDLFASGGSHEGYLTPDELRLIAEWLDIGGQYYNNPFDAPTN